MTFRFRLLNWCILRPQFLLFGRILLLQFVYVSFFDVNNLPASFVFYFCTLFFSILPLQTISNRHYFVFFSFQNFPTKSGTKNKNQTKHAQRTFRGFSRKSAKQNNATNYKENNGKKKAQTNENENGMQRNTYRMLSPWLLCCTELKTHTRTNEQTNKQINKYINKMSKTKATPKRRKIR